MNTVTRFRALLAALFSLLLFCRPARSQQASLKSLANQWAEALNRHDTIRLATLYADSSTLESPNWEGVQKGHASLMQTYGRYFSSTPDLTHEIQEVIATDSMLIIEYRFYGTLSHPEKNTPEYMRGKKYSLKACTVMSLRNGKILHQRTYFDQVGFLRQTGFFDHL